MEVIFHEKQEGSLCAQHCLNSLLQGSYFTPVDLSTLAQELDEEERRQMAECGEESEEYQRFLQQPSGNMDDSGYFSVQVISNALRVWGLELVPYSSTDERIKDCFEEPNRMKAFICNYKDHWFTIRKIGAQWFNLNSLLPHPELISDTYLALFLAQLKNDGYSIFVVLGDLPECQADELLRKNPVRFVTRPALNATTSVESDPELQAALRMSLGDCIDYKRTDSNDADLQEALRLSLQQDDACETGVDDRVLQEDLRLSLDESPTNEDDDDALLRKAIKMSLQC